MTSTHLVHARLRMTALYQWAAERSISDRRGLDTGNALHILLAGMFGKGLIQPFRLMTAGRNPLSTLYGYSREPAEVLRERAHESATPDGLHVLETETIRTKEMPETWAAGKRIGYDTRIRPVRRWKAAKGDNENEKQRSMEIDAYDMARADARGANGNGDRSTGPTPEGTYKAWLEERFNKSATLESCRMALYIEEGGRRGRQRVPRGPTAVLQGTLVIQDGNEFARRLQEGVGRHRAYGFGMLLVRPAE